jgi:putative membrane protein
MRIPKLIVAELRRLTATRMAVLALVALMCVPVLYGALYLWANKNPYAKLNALPAAIVVTDKGVTADGVTTNYGDQVADTVEKSKTFDWQRVSAAEAERGLKDQRFDFAITIPEDFSRLLQSASGDDPEKAQVTLTTNNSTSYLAATIGQSAATSIRSSIVQQVNEQAASRFLVGLADVRGSLGTAVDAAGQLLSGTQSAQSGATTLASGAAQLSSGAAQVSSGADSVSSGAASLSSGLDTLNSNTQSLPSQAQQLADGAQQVASGNAQLAAAADQASAAAQQAVDQLPAIEQQLVADLQAQGVDQSTIDQLTGQLDQLGGALDDGNQQLQQATGQIDQLSSGSQQVAAGAAQLAGSAPALANGIQQAASGASSLADGASTLASGASGVASGASQVATGSASLRDGVGTLASGTAKLQQGLQSGQKQIPATTTAQREAQAKTIADPVSMHNTNVADAGTYGAGLAPFFMPLSAWIGMYALFLIVKAFDTRAITAMRSPIRVALAGWLTPAVLGAVQMVGLFAIVAGVLRLGVANPAGTFGILVVASATFAAIIMTLNIWLGSVGQFLGLVLMVLQLVSAGGTFPWQTLPGPLSWLHHVLPMSYAVDGIRQTMFGGNAALAWGDVGVLALWAGVALLLGIAGVARMTSHRTLRDLQPSLIG